MADLLLFHHAQGLTTGCLSFADDIRAAGHTVHLPDLYEGMTFSDLAEGIAHAEKLGFENVVERGRAAAEHLPQELVYAGFSLGVMPAQFLAQTRPGAKGALLLHGSVPPAEFGSPWPEGLPLQIHTMEADALGDLDVAHHLAETVDGAELFLYPGDDHLFTDSSLPGYAPDATALVKRRILTFLDEVDQRA